MPAFARMFDVFD